MAQKTTVDNPVLCQCATLGSLAGYGGKKEWRTETIYRGNGILIARRV